MPVQHTGSSSFGCFSYQIHRVSCKDKSPLWHSWIRGKFMQWKYTLKYLPRAPTARWKWPIVSVLFLLTNSNCFFSPHNFLHILGTLIKQTQGSRESKRQISMLYHEHNTSQTVLEMPIFLFDGHSWLSFWADLNAWKQYNTQGRIQPDYLSLFYHFIIVFYAAELRFNLWKEDSSRSSTMYY